MQAKHIIRMEIRMYGKKPFLALAAGAVLFGGAVAASASNFTDERDRGNSARQTELDREYARQHPTIMPGTPAYGSPYGYVPPHRAAKHRHPLAEH
jgi:hypothetical protein